MKGSIYLIGGGEIKDGETQIIDDSIKNRAEKDSKFVFFPTAAGDSDGYVSTIESVFGDKFNIVAATEDKGREFIVNAISSAAIIYLGGGTTNLLLELFKKWDLTNTLYQSHEQGVHIAGMSAGALALSAWYIHQEGDSLDLRRGWGLVPACTLVHAQEDSVIRARELWEKHVEARASIFLGIGEGAAWNINTTGSNKVGDGKIW